MLQRIKALWNKLVLFYNLWKVEDEALFIDALYTKGVEDYAFYGMKDNSLYVNSNYYRMGWDDLEGYQNKVNPRGKTETLAFLGEYSSGVASAYVHGKLFFAERIAQDILTGPKWGKAELLEGIQKDKFYASQLRSTPPHMQAGFDNAMIVMNKQAKLLKTDTRTQRIKEIHNDAKNRFGKAAVYKIGELEKLAQAEKV